MIYFLQAGDGGLVKIGRSKSVPGRAEVIQSWEPAKLRLLRSLEVENWVERWLHKRFANHHSHGEWFRHHPEMLTVVPPPEKPKPPASKRRPKPAWPAKEGTCIWTIKSFPVKARKEFVKLAKQRGMTVADLLAVVVREQAARDEARLVMADCCRYVTAASPEMPESGVLLINMEKRGILVTRD